MCKLAVPNINAYMRNTFAVRIEKYEIPSNQVALARLSCQACLRPGSMRDGDAEFIKHVHRKSRAVESFRGRAGRNIRCADQIADDAIHFGVCKNAPNLENKQHR